MKGGCSLSGTCPRVTWPLTVPVLERVSERWLVLSSWLGAWEPRGPSCPHPRVLLQGGTGTGSAAPAPVFLFYLGLGVCVATHLCLLLETGGCSGHLLRQQPGRPLMSTPGCWALSLQSSTQEIGEELVNGVIYSISLRKVQLHHGASKGQRWLGVSVAGVSTQAWQLCQAPSQSHQGPVPPEKTPGLCSPPPPQGPTSTWSGAEALLTAARCGRRCICTFCVVPGVPTAVSCLTAPSPRPTFAHLVPLFSPKQHRHSRQCASLQVAISQSTSPGPSRSWGAVSRLPSLQKGGRGAAVLCGSLPVRPDRLISCPGSSPSPLWVGCSLGLPQEAHHNLRPR